MKMQEKTNKVSAVGEKVHNKKKKISYKAYKVKKLML